MNHSRILVSAKGLSVAYVTIGREQKVVLWASVIGGETLPGDQMEFKDLESARLFAHLMGYCEAF